MTICLNLVCVNFCRLSGRLERAFKGEMIMCLGLETMVIRSRISLEVSLYVIFRPTFWVNLLVLSQLKRKALNSPDYSPFEQAVNCIPVHKNTRFTDFEYLNLMRVKAWHS